MTDEHKKDSLLEDEDGTDNNVGNDQKIREQTERGRLSSFEVISDKASQLEESHYLQSENVSPQNVGRKNSILDSVKSKSKVFFSGSTRNIEKNPPNQISIAPGDISYE